MKRIIVYTIDYSGMALIVYGLSRWSVTAAVIAAGVLLMAIAWGTRIAPQD